MSSPLDHIKGFGAGALAACGAVTVTNPMEIVKIRLQLTGELKGSAGLENPFKAFFTIAREEGWRGMQKGLYPAYGYQVLVNGTRLGMYEPLRQYLQSGVDLFVAAPGSYPGFSMIASGATAGVIGAFVASPLFLVKTVLSLITKRMQSFSEGSGKSVGYQHTDVKLGVFHLIKKIYKNEGVRGLWRGSEASMMRTGVGSAVQLSSYDFFKSNLLLSGFYNKNDGYGDIKLHFSASLITSFFVCLFMNPFDVASTRMYNQNVSSDGKQGMLYRNGFDCLYKTIKTEGMSALYKGFSAHYLRIGPHTILTFVFLEQIRSLMR